MKRSGGVSLESVAEQMKIYPRSNSRGTMGVDEEVVVQAYGLNFPSLEFDASVKLSANSLANEEKIAK